MIDTDKYEGHTKGKWVVLSGSVYLDDEVTPIARMDRDTNHTKPVERDNNARLIADAPLLLAEVKRLREENEKQNNVLTSLDEMIHRSEEHVELMKALEQGLGLPETWKEMIE